MPPPRVRPQTPVDEMTPPVVARPNFSHSRSNSPQVAPPCANARLPAGVDLDLPHQGEIDHHDAVGDGLSGHAVAAAAHRSGEAVFAGETNSLNDIGDARGPHDGRRLAVDHAVPDLARSGVVRIVGGEDRAVEDSAQPASWSVERPSICSFMLERLPNYAVSREMSSG